MVGTMQDVSWRVLLSTLSEADSKLLGSPVPSQHPPGGYNLYDALTLVVDGQYVSALQTAPARGVLEAGLDGIACHDHQVIAAAYFAALERHVSDQQHDEAALATQLLVAVAALLLFLQANLTGPIDVEAPEGIVDLLAGKAKSHSVAQQQRPLGADSVSADDRWAVFELSASGEDVIGRLRLPQYLLLARTILLGPWGEKLTEGSTAETTTAASATDKDGSQASNAESTRGSNQESLTPDQDTASRGAGQRDVGTPWKWWAVRTLVVQQRILSGAAASLLSSLDLLLPQLFKGLEGNSLPDALRPAASRLQAAAHLEAAAAAHDVGRVANGQSHLDTAGSLLGTSFEVTGALGVRTVHQVEAKAQLVVRTGQATLSHDNTCDSGDEAEWLDAAAAGKPDLPPARTGDQGLRISEINGRVITSYYPGEEQTGDYSSSSSQQEGENASRTGKERHQQSVPCVQTVGGPSTRSVELQGLTGDSDVLPVPRFINAEGEEEAGRTLGSAAQALLLGQAQQVQRGTAADELRPWRMAPFIDAVLLQPRSRFLLRTAARLQRARHERERNRTRERALLALQQAVEATEQKLPHQATRMRHAFGVRFPVGPVLRKELGEQLIAAGFVGGAMTLFEELELWDALIVCYRLLGKNVQAEELVNRRLEITPDDPRLWCALGDLTLKDEHFLKAWQRSGQRSTRAQRSLARNAQREKDYEKAAEHWELALAVNPLHSEGWFSLGYCCLKRQNWTRALQAFTRCAQQQPDNGDTWNNLAAIHLQEAHYKEAFSALSEAVKFKRDSWQTWSNYAHAAVQTGNHLQAARGISQVLACSQGQRCEKDLVRALVNAVADGRRAAGTYGQELPGGGRDGAAQLERTVGDLLKQAVLAPSGSTKGLWQLYADFYAATGFHASAREALLKHVRAHQGSGWQKSPEQFEVYGAAVAQYGELQLEGVQRGDLRARDLSSARMLLRGVIKQAMERYEDTATLQRLSRVLADVEAAEADA